MTGPEPWRWRLLRWGYGSYFVCAGLWSLFAGTLYPPWPALVAPGGRPLLDALDASGFLPALAGLSFLAGGAALIAGWIAAGVVLLAPATVVIALFHLVLNGTWFVGLLFPLPLLALARRTRVRLSALLRAG